jgi:beta-fructofuranosidase
VSFDLRDEYVWDFWFTYDEQHRLHHLFFLHAPRTLGDPDLRHRNARVGHAVSPDLMSWEQLADPLPQPAGFDDLAQWTGCALRGPDAWWLFTTGLSNADAGLAQRIGAATSSDLGSWTRTELVVSADPAWYQTLGAGWPEEHWRDPWVLRGDDDRWHLYVTAKDVRGGPGSGVVGHATSPDLRTWEVQPPLSDPTGRFEWLEVIQVVQVEGRWVLLFSCLSPEMPGAAAGDGGVWSVAVDGPGSRVDVASAVRLTDERLYVGKVVEHRGSAYLMAFRNQDLDGEFVGGLIEPVPVTWRPDGRGLAMVVPDRSPPTPDPVPPGPQPLV